jgi:hypothetical protein
MTQIDKWGEGVGAQNILLIYITYYLNCLKALMLKRTFLNSPQRQKSKDEVINHQFPKL